MGSGHVHTITGTSANVHDIVETSKFIREYDEVVYGDSEYQGLTKANVEHPFLVVKKQFGYCKAVYHEIARNMNRFNICNSSVWEMLYK